MLDYNVTVTKQFFKMMSLLSLTVISTELSAPAIRCLHRHMTCYSSTTVTTMTTTTTTTTTTTKLHQTKSKWNRTKTGENTNLNTGSTEENTVL